MTLYKVNSHYRLHHKNRFCILPDDATSSIEHATCKLLNNRGFRIYEKIPGVPIPFSPPGMAYLLEKYPEYFI